MTQIIKKQLAEYIILIKVKRLLYKIEKLPQIS